MDVLLLHAGIADRRMWGPQVEALEAVGHRVHSPDLPGFGDAALEPGTVDYVAFAAGQVDAPAAVVGSSFGGRIALELAVAHPGLVERLVLLGAAIAGWEWSETTAAGLAEEEELIERGDLTGAAAQQARLWLAPDAAPAVRELTEAMTLRSYEQQLPVEGQVQTVWPEPAAAARLDEVRAPTLVAVGSEDLPDIQTMAEQLAAGIPSARLVTIAGAGHLPSLEQPDALNRLLLDFLASP